MPAKTSANSVVTSVTNNRSVLITALVNAGYSPEMVASWDDAVLKAVAAATIEQAKRLAQAEAAARTGLTFKVSTKGAVSVYGLGRFPVTMYRSQWERLLAKKDALEEFIKTNSAKLAVKSE